ncbi:MAG TPA: HAMP domain-containing sensor histidine kinase [Woeseiaceae bacterium]
MTPGGLDLRVLLRTSSFQLTLLYAALFAVSVLVLFGILYWSTIGGLNRQINATIEAEITGLAEQYEREGLAGLVEVVAERVRRDAEGHSVYLFVDGRLRPLAGNLDGWPVGLTATGGWFEFERVSKSGSVVPVRAMVLRVGQNLLLLVGRDVRELAQLNRTFGRALLVGTAIGVLLAFAGGLLMSISAQRRVSAINRTARRIIGGDLHQRVPVTGARDEYDELAVNINAMLEQIESLLEGIRHVGDSIAHDLKTPLTRLRNKLEGLAVGDSDRRGDLEQCVEESDRLLETFNALLRISRIESGAYRAAFAELDLSEMVHDICDLYHAAAEERQITLRCRSKGPVTLFGDRELLAQALTNLLDNAIKYTPAGGQVEVAAQRDGTTCRLVVNDSGPGVPEDQIGNLHRRFVRLDNARSEPGNGLGLALVNAVVEQHRGRMLIGNRHPGLGIVLELPQEAPPQPGHGPDRVDGPSRCA